MVYARREGRLKRVLPEFKGAKFGISLSIPESYGYLRRQEGHSAEAAASGAMAIPRIQAVPVITAVVSSGPLPILSLSGD